MRILWRSGCEENISGTCETCDQKCDDIKILVGCHGRNKGRCENKIKIHKWLVHEPPCPSSDLIGQYTKATKTGLQLRTPCPSVSPRAGRDLRIRVQSIEDIMMIPGGQGPLLTLPFTYQSTCSGHAFFLASRVCVECLIGKQNKPTLFKATDPSSVPYRTPPACAKMAAYPDPPPVIPVPESIAAQVQPPQVTVFWRSKTEMTEY